MKVEQGRVGRRVHWQVRGCDGEVGIAPDAKAVRAGRRKDEIWLVGKEDAG